MSKVSFRSRALDANKPMPVFHASDISDTSEYASINRSVPAMPTGMEKEEEMELHLQQAITAQQAISTGTAVSSASDEQPTINIPIPGVTRSASYEELYPKPSTSGEGVGGESGSEADDGRWREERGTFMVPKSYVKIQASLSLEPEQPDYDMDSEDEAWFDGQSDRLDITPVQFERMMDRLEKASEHQVLVLGEAKLLLQEDDDVSIAVYDYWLTKRLKLKHALRPHVRTEKRDGTCASTNPYMAFRRRGEKIQTRKNRRNDEESYEKMLKIRRDLSKAVTLLDMIKRREKSKREQINLTAEIFDRRVSLEDWDSRIFNQLRAEARPSFQFSKDELQLSKQKQKRANTTGEPSRKRRGRGRAPKSTVLGSGTSVVKKENDAQVVSHEWLLKNEEAWNRPSIFPGSTVKMQAEAEEIASKSDRDSEDEPDGPYTFKRKRGCEYFQVLAHEKEPLPEAACATGRIRANSPVDEARGYRHVYLHGAVSGTLRYAGLARRRYGRGGRLVYDRISGPVKTPQLNNPNSVYFRPTSPVNLVFDEPCWNLPSTSAGFPSCSGGPGPSGLTRGFSTPCSRAAARPLSPSAFLVTPGGDDGNGGSAGRLGPRDDGRPTAAILTSSGPAFAALTPGLGSASYPTHLTQLANWLRDQALASGKQPIVVKPSSRPGSPSAPSSSDCSKRNSIFSLNNNTNNNSNSSASRTRMKNSPARSSCSNGGGGEFYFPFLSTVHASEAQFACNSLTTSRAYAALIQQRAAAMAQQQQVQAVASGSATNAAAGLPPLPKQARLVPTPGGYNGQPRSAAISSSYPPTQQGHSYITAMTSSTHRHHQQQQQLAGDHRHRSHATTVSNRRGVGTPALVGHHQRRVQQAQQPQQQAIPDATTVQVTLSAGGAGGSVVTPGGRLNLIPAGLPAVSSGHSGGLTAGQQPSHQSLLKGTTGVVSSASPGFTRGTTISVDRTLLANLRLQSHPDGTQGFSLVAAAPAAPTSASGLAGTPGVTHLIPTTAGTAGGPRNMMGSYPPVTVRAAPQQARRLDDHSPLTGAAAVTVTTLVPPHLGAVQSRTPPTTPSTGESSPAGTKSKGALEGGELTSAQLAQILEMYQQPTNTGNRVNYGFVEQRRSPSSTPQSSSRVKSRHHGGQQQSAATLNSLNHRQSVTSVRLKGNQPGITVSTKQMLSTPPNLGSLQQHQQHQQGTPSSQHGAGHHGSTYQSPPVNGMPPPAQPPPAPGPDQARFAAVAFAKSGVT